MRYSERMLRTLGRLLLLVAACVLGACSAAPDRVELTANALETCALPGRARRVEVVVTPDDGDERVLELLAGAARSIDVTIYQLSSRRILDALKAAAARGVRVRVIQDRREAFEPIVAELTAAGVAVHRSSSSFQLTHQKTITVDAQKSFVFSGNFGRRGFSGGRNFGVVDDDPEDVGDLEELFAADWEGRAPVLGCTRLVLSPNNARERVLALIDGATTSLDVEAMYVTDRDVVDAVVAAAERGVEVRVLLNDPAHGFGDSSALVERLAAHGVVAHRSGSLFVHAKLLVADHDHAFVGSENFSWNSLTRNREAGVVVARSEADVERIERIFVADWSAAPLFEVTSGTDPSR